MKIAMKVKKLTRRHICSVNKCRNRDTFLVHRGDDVNHQPLYLCEDCIRDIVHEYIGAVGAEHARDVLGVVLSVLTSEENVTESEEKPVKKPVKKTTGKGE